MASWLAVHQVVACQGPCACSGHQQLFLGLLQLHNTSDGTSISVSMSTRHARPRPRICATCNSLQVIKGFDTAVTGLAVGESRKARIEPEDAVRGCGVLLCLQPCMGM